MSQQPKADLEDWDQAIESYLLREVQEGSNFFKSRYIASEFGVTSKKVGSTLYRLSNTSSALSIEVWGGTSDGSTWYICPCDE